MADGDNAGSPPLPSTSRGRGTASHDLPSSSRRRSGSPPPRPSSSRGHIYRGWPSSSRGVTPRFRNFCITNEHPDGIVFCEPVGSVAEDEMPSDQDEEGPTPSLSPPPLSSSSSSSFLSPSPSPSPSPTSSSCMKSPPSFSLSSLSDDDTITVDNDTITLSSLSSLDEDDHELDEAESRPKTSKTDRADKTQKQKTSKTDKADKTQKQKTSKTDKADKTQKQKTSKTDRADKTQKQKTSKTDRADKTQKQKTSKTDKADKTQKQKTSKTDRADKTQKQKTSDDDVHTDENVNAEEPVVQPQPPPVVGHAAVVAIEDTEIPEYLHHKKFNYKQVQAAAVARSKELNVDNLRLSAYITQDQAASRLKALGDLQEAQKEIDDFAAIICASNMYRLNLARGDNGTGGSIGPGQQPTSSGNQFPAIAELHEERKMALTTSVTSGDAGHGHGSSSGHGAKASASTAAIVQTAGILANDIAIGDGNNDSYPVTGMTSGKGSYFQAISPDHASDYDLISDAED